MEKLVYTEFRGSKDILTIDLHNDYTVIAIKIWNADKGNYTVQLMLKKNTIDMWSLIENAESLEFDTNYKFINKTILKKVAELFGEGFFDYYINRYEYEMKCFDFANGELEKIAKSKSDKDKLIEKFLYGNDK